MNYLVSAVDTVGCLRLGVQPGSSNQLRGYCSACSRSGPDGEELSEWHFLRDLRVLGTACRQSLRRGHCKAGVRGPGPTSCP